MRKATGSDQQNWYHRPAGGPQARPRPTAAGQASPAGGTASGGSRSGKTPATGEEFAEASKWHSRLSETVEQVTSELEQEFRAEAKRTLRILAAAIDLFKDTATATPDAERQFEKLCEPVQREIWPADFGGGTAKVIADLAALHQRAAEAESAADRVASLAAKARRL
jgi:hypothetical protein